TARADAAGNIAAEYQGPINNWRDYTITAADSKSDARAAAGGSEAANLDQCANGQATIPPSSLACTGNNWVNGNVNGSKAHYQEGDSVAYRMIMTNVPAGARHVTIQWDTS